MWPDMSVSHKANARYAREIIYIWLPDLPALRLCAQQGWDQQTAIGLYQAAAGRQIITHLSPAARAAGLQVGRSVSDSRALLPSCRFRAYQPVDTLSYLRQLAHWAWRYSPQVGLDADHLGIWIDTTGASHLWGGVSAILADIDHHLTGLGLTVFLAAAPTYGAAWALAHYHPKASQHGVIAPSGRAGLLAYCAELPLAALRLPSDQLQAFSQSGLRQIGGMLGLARTALTSRFGPLPVLRRDQLAGDRDERLTPLPVHQPVMLTRQYSEPLAGLASITQMLAEFSSDLADMLAQRQLLARVIEIGWQEVDGRQSRHRLSLSRPSRDKAILDRLILPQADRIEAEFGLEYSWIEAGRLSHGLPSDQSFDGQHAPHETTDRLVDLLGARLGADKIIRLVPKTSWQPEESQAQHAAASYADLPEAQINWHHICADISPKRLHSPRPIRLLSLPDEVRAIALLPDHPPSLLRWRRQNWTIRRASGPERIGPRWWGHQAMTGGPNAHKRSRDYYRLETQSGARLWVYREGLPERGEPMRWFLHGFFA